MSQKAQGMMRHLALAAATIVAGVLLGLASVPSSALAEDDTDKRWKCISKDDCGKGDKECCENGGTDDKICSTNCVIVVE